MNKPQLGGNKTINGAWGDNCVCMSVFVFVSAQLLCTSSARVSVLSAIKTTRLKAKMSSQRTQNSEHGDDVVIKGL